MKHNENLCSKDESIRKSVENSLEGDDGGSAGVEEKDGKLERTNPNRDSATAETVDPLTRESLSATEHWFDHTHACGHVYTYTRAIACTMSGRAYC